MLYMKIQFGWMGVDYLTNSSGILGYPFGVNNVGSLSYTIYKNKFHMKGLNKNSALNVEEYICILGVRETVTTAVNQQKDVFVWNLTSEWKNTLYKQWVW